MLKRYYFSHIFMAVTLSLLHTLIYSQPDLQWVARYIGPDKLQDVPHSMAVDEKGNVYVTGQSGGENTESDFITIKYDIDGHELWAKRYNNINNLSDGPTGIVTDLHGNVYVTGWSYLNVQSTSFTTIKYNAHGTEVWVRQYSGIGNSWNTAQSIGMDAIGDIYITGVSKGPEGNDDYVTIKYDGAGNEKWIRRYNSPENTNDYPYSLAVSKSGNVYVTGESNYTLGTIKYDKDGNLMWSERYNRPGDMFGVAKKIILDNNENVFVTGESYNSATNYDFVTIKYDSDGSELWAQRYNSLQNLSDQGISLGIDDFGNVYVTGFSYNNTNWSNYATVKYDAAGNQKWVRIYDGTSSLSSETPKALVTDRAGNTFVTGTTHPQDGDADFATIAYDSSGNELWIRKYDDDPGSMDQSHAIALDHVGNVYVTGSIHEKDIATVKYASGLTLKVEATDTILYTGYEPTCTRLFTNVSGGRPPYRYEWTPSASSTPDIVVCPTNNTTYTVTVIDADGKIASGNVVLTVIDVRCQKNKVMVCHKGTLLCLPKEAVKAHLAHGDALGDANCNQPPHPVRSFKITVAPNPFINTTRLQYTVPENGKVLIAIFDSKGKLISIPVNSDKKPGTYNVNFNAAHLSHGTYYYNGTFLSKTNTQFESGKMIKIK